MKKSFSLLISMFLLSGFLLPFSHQEPADPLPHDEEMFLLGEEDPVEPDAPPMGPMGPFGRFDKFGRWWKNSRFVKELNLTDAQINKIDKIFLETQKKIVDLRASCKKAELDLRDLEGKEAESLKKIDEIYKLRAEIHKNIFLMASQIRKELTPEQLKKLEEIKATIAQEKARRFKERRFHPRKE